MTPRTPSSSGPPRRPLTTRERMAWYRERIRARKRSPLPSGKLGDADEDRSAQVPGPEAAR